MTPAQILAAAAWADVAQKTLLSVTAAFARIKNGNLTDVELQAEHAKASTAFQIIDNWKPGA